MAFISSFVKTLCRYFYIKCILLCHLSKWMKSLVRSPKTLICVYLQILYITAKSYIKRKKYLSIGNTTKDTQKAHAQSRGTAPSRTDQKQAHILHGLPRSTSMVRQVCQKTIWSSLAQPNLVRNEPAGCWGLEMGVWGEVPMAKGVRGCGHEHPCQCGDTPRDCSHRWPTP